MLSKIDIPQIIRDAHNFDFWGEQTTDADISKVVGEFLDELARSKIDFVLVGGIALLAYVRGRNTKDIDLIVAIPDLQQISELKITYQDADFARADFRGLQCAPFALSARKF